MLILKFPRFFPHRVAELKSAAISKQTYLLITKSCSYITLALT